MIDLTSEQVRELRRYADNQPHRFERRPNRNLIRRNLLTLAPAAGTGYYVLTEKGRAALTERFPDFEIDDDDLWPRDEDHRFRLYAVRGDEREVLAAAPDGGGIGLAIVTLNDDLRTEGRGRRLYDLGRIGVLDVLPEGKPSPHGEWIILPWPRGGRT